MANFAEIQQPLKSTVPKEVPGDNHHVPIPTTTKTKKKRDHSVLRKAPQAPKRFKSSYIMFFMAKQTEIKSELGPGAAVGDVSKRSSEKWKKLNPEERAYWDEKARIDKERYNMEKANYTGPWQVPWKRAKKDPAAPKRPMSAFLYFSQDRRRDIKEANPGMRNTEISRILGGMWKQAPESERSPHIAKEAEERKKYKIRIADWKSKEEERKKEAQKLLEQQQAMYPPPQQYPPHEQPIPQREDQAYPVQSQQYHPPLVRSESPHPPPQPEPVNSQQSYYQGYPQEYYHPPPTYGPPPTHYAGYQQPPQQHHQQPPQQAYHPQQPQSYTYDYAVNEYQHRPDVDEQSHRTQNSCYPESAPPNDDQLFENQPAPSEYASTSFPSYPPQNPGYHYDQNRPPSTHSFPGDEF